MNVELPTNTYWVLSGQLLAGSYPTLAAGASNGPPIQTLKAAGIDYFIDLTRPGEMFPYDQLFPDPYDLAGAAPIYYAKRPIADHGVPNNAAQMIEILDDIDEALAAGHRIYVHCRAGVGRTGMVIGCYLARCLGSGDKALETLGERWQSGTLATEFSRTPETDPQVEYVRQWPTKDRPGTNRTRSSSFGKSSQATSPAVAASLEDRYRGLLFGLALGDALGQSTQGIGQAEFGPVHELSGGGPYRLAPGVWADKASQALVVAESLLAAEGFDAVDQLNRLRHWQLTGFPSPTGACTGISAGMTKALAQWQWTGNPFSGSHDPGRADQEPLVRAGVVAAFALEDPPKAVSIAVDVSRLTHQAPVVLDCMRYFTVLMVGALRGEPKSHLLESGYTPAPNAWNQAALRPEVRAIVSGGWGISAPPLPSGRALDGLSIALWALATGHTFAETVLLAVSLGGESQGAGALAGQLAGAVYGARAIPENWMRQLAFSDLLQATADRLRAFALRDGGSAAAP